MGKMLYTNLMVTTNQKPLIDVQKIKRKEFNDITKESQKTMREKSKSRKEQRGTTETTTKQVTSTYLSTITLNVNGLNAPTKQERISSRKKTITSTNGAGRTAQQHEKEGNWTTFLYHKQK